MLRFRVLGVPVLIEGWFWLSAVLLGGGLNAQRPRDWQEVATWTAVLLVSILAHELGHALAGLKFGAHPAIKLHGFGGLTILPGTAFTRRQSIIVSAAGPAAGLLLGLVVLLVDRMTPPGSWMARFAIVQALHINFFWTAINLLPIQPMDGGQILREVLGPERRRLTAVIGGVLAVLLCLLSLKWGLIYLGFMMALFAYYNFRQEPLEGGVIKS